MDQQQQSRWQPTRRQLLWAVSIVGFVVLLLLIRLGYTYRVTGFGQYKVNGELQPFKTLWDWLDLLIVPVVLAIGGYLFTLSESQATREAAERRTQDEALQAYLDQMGQLLLDKDRPLRQSKEDDEVRTLARARTLTLLSRLDRARKRSAVQFLYESGLVDKERRIVDLTGADLSRANLSGANLSDADLRDADLGGADLGNANLGAANLRGVNLRGANLRRAYPRGANLGGADLRDADLRDATGKTYEELEQQAESLEGTTMPNGQKYEDWLKDREGREEDTGNE